MDAKGGDPMTGERIRERARQQACKLLFGAHWEAIYATPINEMSLEAQRDIAHYTEKLIAFALSERDTAIEQCCQDLCEDCKLNGAPQFINGEFIHPYGMGSGARCDAAAIRTRVAAQGEK